MTSYGWRNGWQKRESVLEESVESHAALIWL